MSERELSEGDQLHRDGGKLNSDGERPVSVYRRRNTMTHNTYKGINQRYLKKKGKQQKG